MGRIDGYYHDFEDPDYRALNREINGLLGGLPYFYQVPPELFSSKIPSVDSAPFFDFRHALSTTSDENALGLRLYIVPPDANSKRTSRYLAESGLVKTGDILLSFRQGTSGTGEYQHLQLGLTHTGVALVRDGALFNIDSPLSYSGQLDHEHYTESQLMLHVLRPDVSDTERSNIQKWAELLYDGRDVLKSLLTFCSDYGAPKSADGHDKEVFNLGQLILTQAARGYSTSMYCSEFAWHLLALRRCDPDDSAVIDQFKSGRHETFDGDLSPLFSPMPVLGTALLEPDTGTPGLSDGIGLILGSLEVTPDQLDELLDRAFATWDPHFSGGQPPYSISSGHQAQADKFKPLYGPLKEYFRAVKLDPESARAIKTSLDGQLQGQENYSPTAYLVQALLPETSTRRVMSYVGTISFPTSGQLSLIEQKFPKQLSHMFSMRPEALGQVPETSAVEYRDGFRGDRFFKRRQVKKLQCMLNHLGHNAGEVDGLYGQATVLAVRRYLDASNLEGDGRSVTWPLWQALEHHAGDVCSEFGSDS
jgi:hypothetical protein